MWTHYEKTFRFRDCFGEDVAEGDILAINKLLKLEQHDGGKGVLITTDVISTTISNELVAFKNENEGIWNLCFMQDNRRIADTSLWDYEEIHLIFDIEENLETGKLIIHSCNIKAFKEYQK